VLACAEEPGVDTVVVLAPVFVAEPSIDGGSGLSARGLIPSDTDDSGVASSFELLARWGTEIAERRGREKFTASLPVEVGLTNAQP